MKKLFLAASFVVVTAAGAQADSVFSHDEQGSAISGSIVDLISAVEAGRQIVVGYNSGDIRWLRTCEHTSIQDQVVSCYVANVFDTTDGGGSRTFDNPAAVEAHIFNTTGFNAALKQSFYTGEELSISPNPRQRTLDWYAR